MTEENTEASAEPSFKAWGARLVEARESVSYTREQVASELNLPPEYIEILEQGGLDGLPSIVFAKGYIRGYAKLVHLDSDELITEYEQLHGVVSSKGQIRPVGKEHQQVKMSHPAMKLTSWLIVLAIVGVTTSVVAAYYYLNVIKVIFFDQASEKPTYTPQCSPLLSFIYWPALILTMTLVAIPDWLLYEAEQAALSLY